MMQVPKESRLHLLSPVQRTESGRVAGRGAAGQTIPEGGRAILQVLIYIYNTPRGIDMVGKFTEAEKYWGSANTAM